ncbi:MAG TPA: hypothetical protein VFL73_07570 [Solirubrobacteraceae bacterium]|jgi:hypothetical protein|nr:hypothetical protein [Solirubrobacteraceae bacterium]
MSRCEETEKYLKLIESVIDAVADVEPEAFDAELIGAAYSRAARSLHDTMAAALAGNGPWLTRWEAAVCASLELMRRRPGIARLVFVESESGLPTIRERRELHRRDFVELFASEYGRDGQLQDLPLLQVELVAGAAYRAFHEEAVAGRLTAAPAQAIPRLIDAMAVFQPVPA